MSTSILWKRLDRPGHEAARLEESGAKRLSGTAVFIESGQAVRLDYLIVCDAAWRTQSATVRGWIGPRPIAVEIAAGADNRWLMNGAPVAAVDGCVDIDLNFSPSTNLLPIRRLDLQIGESALVRAAWLRFPSFELEVLEQTYTRLLERRYQYTSGSFRAELEVNEAGLPTSYAGVWVAET